MIVFFLDLDLFCLPMSAKILVSSLICVSWRSAWNASSFSVACSSNRSWRTIPSFSSSFLTCRWYSSRRTPAPIKKIIISPSRFDPNSIAICSFSFGTEIGFPSCKNIILVICLHCNINLILKLFTYIHSPHLCFHFTPVVKLSWRHADKSTEMFLNPKISDSTFAKSDYLNSGLFFARFLRRFAMGFEICFIARTPSLATGNAPTITIVITLNGINVRFGLFKEFFIKSICNFFLEVQNYSDR